VIEQVATIVAAYVKNNQVAPTEVSTLIENVNAALTHLGQAPVEAPAEQTPAVSVRRSVTPERIVCLDCGYGGKMLKRHLATRHDLTPDAYRAKWHLPADYPLVAPAYASRRSELAKSIGLGQRGRGGRNKV
jgi:predicted transcriptional regulator